MRHPPDATGVHSTGTDPDLTGANPAVAALMARRGAEATLEQRRTTAEAGASVARHTLQYRAAVVGERLVAVPRFPARVPQRRCSAAVRPRSRARRSPRASRAGPSDDDGAGEPDPPWLPGHGDAETHPAPPGPRIPGDDWLGGCF